MSTPEPFTAPPQLPLASVGGDDFLRGHSPLAGLAFTDAWLCAIADNASLSIFDRASGARLHTLWQSRRSLCTLDTHPAGAIAVWGIHGSPVEVHDLRSKKKLVSLPVQDVRAVAVSPDGSEVLVGGDRAVRRFRLDDGSEIGSLTGHRTMVRALAYSPDGRWGFSGGEDGVIKRHELSGKKKKCKASPVTKDKLYANHLAVSPDGERLLALCWGTPSLMDLAQDRPTVEGDHQARWVGFTPSGEILSVGEHGIAWLDPDDLSVQRTVVEGDFALAALSPDGATLAVTPNYPINMLETTVCFLVDLSTGAVQRPAGHRRFISSVVGLSKGEALSGSWDGRLLRWKGGACKEICSGGDIDCIAVDPKERYVALAPFSNNAPLRLLHLENGTIASFPDIEHERRPGIREVTHVPVRDTLLVNRGSELWELSLPDLAERKLGKHRAFIECIAVSPDGTKALTGGQDGHAKLWDLENGELLKDFPGQTGHFVSHAAFHPSGKEVVFDQRGLVSYDVRTEAIRKLETLPELAGLTFSPNGKFLVAAYSEHGLRVWSWPKAEKVLDVDLGEESVRTVSFSREGDFLWVGTERGMLFQLRWEIDS